MAAVSYTHLDVYKRQGCGVPGVMASRTIENERDRRMTIMTTCFIPCGAKMPIIGPVSYTHLDVYKRQR